MLKNSLLKIAKISEDQLRRLKEMAMFNFAVPTPQQEKELRFNQQIDFLIVAWNNAVDQELKQFKLQEEEIRLAKKAEKLLQKKSAQLKWRQKWVAVQQRAEKICKSLEELETQSILPSMIETLFTNALRKGLFERAIRFLGEKWNILLNLLEKDELLKSARYLNSIIAEERETELIRLAAIVTY